MKAMAAGVSVFWAVVSAHAAPGQLTHYGRLLDSAGHPVTTPKDLLFELYDEPEGGELKWSETVTVQFDARGYYTAQLGTDAASDSLTAEILRLPSLYLQITIDEEPLLPRAQLTRVPYAVSSQHADVAATLSGGEVNATSISVNGRPVVDDQGNWVGTSVDEDTLAALAVTCNTGDVPVYDGAWQCKPSYTDERARAAVGPHVVDTTLTEDDVERYISNASIDLAAGSSVDGELISTGAHYTDAQATKAMGRNEPSNPLHHDRYSDDDVKRVLGLEQVAVPAGAVMHFAMDTCPAGWTPADGRALDRSEYQRLFSAIGVTFGIGDSVTTFGLPDLRGEFVRGWSGTRDVDPGREFGASQSDGFQSHRHAVDGHSHSDRGHTHAENDSGHNHTTPDHTHSEEGVRFVNHGGSGWQMHPVANPANYYFTETSNTSGATSFTTRSTKVDLQQATASIRESKAQILEPAQSPHNSPPRHGAETRPRNIALLACIKF